MQQFQPAVEMFGDGGAGFDEIAGVHIGDPVDVADRGVMDMAADDAVDAALARLAGQQHLEVADEIDGVLDLELGPFREGPIGQAEFSAARH